MPAVAFTLAFGAGAIASAKQLRATFKAHHPDVPFFLIDDALWPAFAGQPQIAHNGEIMGMRILAGYFLSLHYDRVIYLDADTLVLGPLKGLLEAQGPGILTHDVSHFTYGLPAPTINAGVLAATSTSFWRTWFVMNYSFLLPMIGAFFDQFALRMLCMQGDMPYTLLPERTEKDYYNLGYREEAGEWRRAGTDIFKGEARVRLWHWAGPLKTSTLADLPAPVRESVEASLAAQSNETALAADTRRMLLPLIARYGPIYREMLQKEFQSLTTLFLNQFEVKEKSEAPGVYCSDAPAAWDAFRPEMPGIHRRLLPNAPRYVYAATPERLQQPDVEALDRPRVAS